VSTVAAFDFDGTLTRHDTLVPFLMRVRGRLPVLRALAAAAPVLAREGRHAGKEALLKATIRGWWLDELQPLADDYAHHVVQTQLRDDRVARLQWHLQQNHRVVIVSASPELYVARVAALLGCTATLATKLEVDARGRLTGRIFEQNVRGPVKAELLRAWLGANTDNGDTPVILHAYGDSDGDTEMLAIAVHATHLRGRDVLSAAPG
jgi:phosphatidylglycerophosphatase C